MRALPLAARGPPNARHIPATAVLALSDLIPPFERGSDVPLTPESDALLIPQFDDALVWDDAAHLGAATGWNPCIPLPSR